LKRKILLVEFLRNEITHLRNEEIKIIDNFEKTNEQLEIFLKSINKHDNRQINGIDISVHKENLEIFLIDFFDISKEELENDEQRQRFDLEIKRANLTIELEQIRNKIANSNTRLITEDPTLDIILIETFDVNTLDVYRKITFLERDLRNWILNILEKIGKNGWEDLIPVETQKKTNELFDVENSKLNNIPNILRKIDFLDFSDYEAIFKQSRKIILHRFFNGSEEGRWKTVSSLGALRELRNKIMHRPPLNNIEIMNFHTHYSIIRTHVDNAKTLT